MVISRKVHEGSVYILDMLDILLRFVFLQQLLLQLRFVLIQCTEQDHIVMVLLEGPLEQDVLGDRLLQGLIVIPNIGVRNVLLECLFVPGVHTLLLRHFIRELLHFFMELVGLANLWL